MNRIVDLMIRLVGSAVCGIPFEQEVCLTSEQAKKLYVLSKKHDVPHLVRHAMEKNNICIDEPDVAKQFEKQHLLAVVRYERINYDYAQICDAFEEAKLPYIPLKGSVIRKLYPEGWMRTSCDIDVLIHKNDLVRAKSLLEEKLGYTQKEIGNHDIGMISPGGVHVELHYALSDDNDKDAILKNAWDYSSVCDGFEYKTEFCDAMFCYYHISHMAKHFLDGGCGIKPFLDLWLLCHKKQYNRDERYALLRKGGLDTFAENAEHLSEVWFTDAEHTEITAAMEEYLIDGGVYGSRENKSDVSEYKSKKRSGYILSRIWLPKSVMTVRYPSLAKRQWMLPFYQVHRWAAIAVKFFSGNRNGNKTSPACKESGTSQKVELMKKLGL